MAASGDPRRNSSDARLRIARDTVILALAVFVTVVAALRVHDPPSRLILLGFAASLLGLPATFRVAERRNNDKEG